jgi:hypothetical protein
VSYYNRSGTTLAMLGKIHLLGFKIPDTNLLMIFEYTDVDILSGRSNIQFVSHSLWSTRQHNIEMFIRRYFSDQDFGSLQYLVMNLV